MTSILLNEKPNKKEKRIEILDLSVSKIKTFDSCAKKFKYLYIEKIPRLEKPYHIFGKYLHLVLELFHKDLLENPQQNILELMSSCQEKALETWGHKMDSEQKKETYDILQKYLTTYKNTLKSKKQSKIIGLEKEFNICIDDLILLNGFIDLLKQDKDGVYSVEDYKSTKDKKYLKKDFFQLLIYAYATYLMFPNIKKVRGKYIMLRHDFEVIETEFSLKEILSVEHKLLEYADRIKSERLFRANPTPLCPWCDAVDICEDKWVKFEKNKIRVKNSEEKKHGVCDW